MPISQVDSPGAVTISVSIAGVRKSFTPAGLQAVLDALEVGAKGLGAWSAAEAEVETLIEMVRTASRSANAYKGSMLAGDCDDGPC